MVKARKQALKVSQLLGMEVSRELFILKNSLIKEVASFTKVVSDNKKLLSFHLPNFAELSEKSKAAITGAWSEIKIDQISEELIEGSKGLLWF